MEQHDDNYAVHNAQHFVQREAHYYLGAVELNNNDKLHHNRPHNDMGAVVFHNDDKHNDPIH